MAATARSATDEAHWDELYEHSPPEELGWYEPVPSTLELVTAHSQVHDPVIDVGGGAGLLVRELLERGYTDLTVLDLSAVALERSRRALGADAAVVRWLHADVTELVPHRRWSLWHDRAVFHFLVDAELRQRYRRVAATAVEPGGVVVMATFAPGGPERCAGLPVRRYDPDALAEELAPEFELVSGAPLLPPSGEGDQRPYVGVVLRRIGAD